MNHTILPGQVYRSCRPFDATTLCIAEYEPGRPYADAADPDTGRNPCVVLTADLHASPVTPTGERRLEGFVLAR